MNGSAMSSETVIIGQYRNKRVYHTDPECPAVENLNRTREVSKSRYPNYDHCEYCRGTVNFGGGMQESSYKDCPYCGEEVYSIAKHLPCSES